MSTLNPQDVFLRLLVTVLCVSLIGFDRERSGRSAGLRTHLIVAVSACMITLIQLELTESVIEFNRAHPDLLGIISSDPSRLIAQIVSGIGFLGAGTIIINRNATVTGLTTAATLWGSAALGIGAGLGYFTIVISSTIVMLFILIAINLMLTDRSYVLDIYFNEPRSKLKDLHDIIDRNHLKVKDIIISTNSGSYHYQFKMTGDRRKIDVEAITRTIWDKVANVKSVTFI